ncbi:MAG: ATP-binding cassette domain-containing protein [Lachnospiraceae bacterium]|nr:ATP-binding cassette domain-containing protein [Lachnospiraceae bacterium]
MYLEMKHITKSFGDFSVSRDVNFSVEKGELAALLGPSGCGKTTILRMIAGIEHPDSGDILIGGKRVNDIPASERRIGFVFQNYALFRYMTVYDNIAFGLQVRKIPHSAVRARVNELIALTGLDGLEKRYPNELSGGQKQRVAFARAIAPEPDLLLLDEPFTAIDAKIRKELRQWLRDMIHRVGITSIFVTHDQNEAVEVADRIIVTNKGSVEQEGGASDIYRLPRTAFVSEFIGEPVIVEDFGRLKGFEKGNYERAIIRPEFVEAFKSDNEHFRDMLPFSQNGIIRDITFKGNAYELHLSVNGTELICHRSPERRAIYVGEEMNVIVYRLFAIKGNQAMLMQNKNFMEKDPDGINLEKYLYAEGGYYVE